MVAISTKETEFNQALAAFLVHEEKVNLRKLSQEEFEEIGVKVREWMTGDEAEIISALRFRAARHQRLNSQFQGLILSWCALNVYLFSSVGFDHLLTWQAALWLVVGTVSVLTFVAFIGASLENFAGMFMGIHHKVIRVLKYISMFLVYSPLFHLLMTGKFHF